MVYTLCGRTGSALASASAFRMSHVRGSLSAASLVICSPHCTVKYVELRGYCPVQGGGVRPVNWIYRL